MERNLRLCSHCGQKVALNAKFCSNCGVKFLAPIANFMIRSQDSRDTMSATQRKQFKKMLDHFEVD